MMDKTDSTDRKIGRRLLTLVITSVLLLSAMVIAVGVEAREGNEIQAAQGINDWNDLDDVRNDLDGNYVLNSDLDEDTAGYDQLVNTQDGWNPIENFTGTFDGNGYKISDLYIDRNETSDVGLFGSIEDGSEITDVGLVDAHVRGNISVGGLVGSNYGTVSKSFTIGNVSGENWYVGGLVGENNDGMVKKSFTADKVNGSTYVGGLVGYNTGSLATVENSFSTAAVIGYWFIGGLVGGNNKGTVSTSYAAGGVGGEIERGLVGFNNGFVSDSYWDNETINIDSSSNESVEAIPLSTDEMTGTDAPDNMVGFDFEGTWETVVADDVDTDEDGYPILQDLSSEQQLIAQDMAPEEELTNPETPGFTSTLLLVAGITAIALYRKKKR